MKQFTLEQIRNISDLDLLIDQAVIFVTHKGRRTVGEFEAMRRTIEQKAEKFEITSTVLSVLVSDRIKKLGLK